MYKLHCIDINDPYDGYITEVALLDDSRDLRPQVARFLENVLEYETSAAEGLANSAEIYPTFFLDENGVAYTGVFTKREDGDI